MKVRQRVQTAYEWMYLFCVVDGRSGRLLWSWIDSMKPDRIAVAVNGRKREMEMEALVWDGARGHRSRLVEARWDCRRWRSRRTVLSSILPSECSGRSGGGVEGRVYGSIEEKVEAVNAYLR